MEKKFLPLSSRCLLPQLPETLVLFQILDNLDVSIMLVDDNTRIVYFNNNYLSTYENVWESVDVSAEQILGIVLNDRADPDNQAIRNINLTIQNKTDSNKTFYMEKDSGFTGLADLIHIELPQFSGVAIIQIAQHNLANLASKIRYYKDMYEQLHSELISKESLPPGFQQVTGNSPKFVQVLRMAARVAPTQSSVCILGESGTGKEVLAETIHYNSSRADGPFIRVNCAAIPESLMESELFGYEKGAFTGASSTGKAGKFELANHGTLFLDEIGEMPLSMQVKLLRALQEKEITRIGGSKPIKLDFRLITATNRNLEQMIEEGTFREDIYYRICIIPLHLPPLRERKSDIPLLADLFLHDLDLPAFEQRSFSDEVMDHLKNYPWPGNIRELKNCVERMAILCLDEEIGMDYLPQSIVQYEKKEGSKKEQFIADNYNLKNLVDKVEYDTIQTVLSMTNGNKAKAIDILGISKRTFYMKLEKFGLK